MNTNLQEDYATLQISPGASNEEITKAFKKLAKEYHPDKNADRIEWANQTMAKINTAYNSIMSSRFQDKQNEKVYYNYKPAPPQPDRSKEYANEILREGYIDNFITIREGVKDSLYRYFQYGLNNFFERDKISNKAVFNEIVISLRKCYHSINELLKKTDDDELVKHFTVFNDMIFNFYKASECLNILDSYSNYLDVEAYRMYAEGDVLLHRAHKEVFYDRHNRGYFKQDFAIENAGHAKIYFKNTIAEYPKSSWVTEATIKFNYTTALIEYIILFFNED